LLSETYIAPDELSLSDGRLLVRLAREAISSYLTRGEVLKPKAGVPSKLFRRGMTFVTILKFPTLELRGCIGYTSPMEPLAANVVNAAIAAATQDPRFPPLTINELRGVVIEVSVLSIPKPTSPNPEDRLSSFTIGRHGLVVEHGFNKGLLLPEVPVEHCWDGETFLSETCLKAGLPPDCWLNAKVSLLTFYARTFREVKPGGDVMERDLTKEYRDRCRHLFTLKETP